MNPPLTQDLDLPVQYGSRWPETPVKLSIISNYTFKINEAVTPVSGIQELVAGLCTGLDSWALSHLCHVLCLHPHRLAPPCLAGD